MIRRSLYAVGAVLVSVGAACGTTDAGPTGFGGDDSGIGVANGSGSSGAPIAGNSSSGAGPGGSSGSGAGSGARDAGSGSGSGSSSSSGSSTGSASSSGGRDGGAGSSSSSSSSGGRSSSGSSSGSGSSSSSSGSSSGSSSSSSSSSGGTGTGTCTWTGGPTTSSGELTCYWFGQGPMQRSGCPTYKSFCGYCVSETGGGSGICPSGITDTAPNIASPYFAAFPVGTFGAGTYCGMCVDVTYQGKTITATVIDECATCPTAGHIDLSLSASAALGLGQGTTPGDVTNGVTWKSVACPVTGPIVSVYNNGQPGQIYFQNVVFPVASAVAGGHTATQRTGFWDFGASVAGQQVTLTDTLGHRIVGTISANGSGIGAQFPATCP